MNEKFRYFSMSLLSMSMYFLNTWKLNNFLIFSL